ncbi:hypothetical protein CASFOL_026961 [Castilleja foliolosa]|uniref:Uncharacterized protein n=1 Tax=Castilleja foliolosa TaxID=1961234 RepID=A0ABD3CKD9_9LAMI
MDVKVEEDVEFGTSNKKVRQESSELTTEQEKAIDRTYLILIADLDNNNLLAAVHEGNHCFRMDVKHFQSSLNKRWPLRMLDLLRKDQQRRPSQWIIDTSRRLHD